MVSLQSILKLTTILLSSCKISYGFFFFPDFNQTLGLVFNGDATTSDCYEMEEDLNPVEVERLGELYGLHYKEVTTTEKNSSAPNIGLKSLYEYNAQFGHLDTYKSSIKDGCKTRLRLTSSRPSQVSSVWYAKRLPVVSGRI
mmetsp:Transcript_17661/g.24912  ORF Transcript_17661/g.24912 Transcript_17661/m.24912 type:complete len:142 (+) Transcript_17661:349-774(+)